GSSPWPCCRYFTGSARGGGGALSNVFANSPRNGCGAGAGPHVAAVAINFHFENVRHPTPCNSAKHRTRQPPIGKRIFPIIHTSILNVNVWWYSSSTHAAASKVIIWCPLERWIRSSVIPGRFLGWQSWQVHQQSSFATIIRAVI